MSNFDHSPPPYTPVQEANHKLLLRSLDYDNTVFLQYSIIDILAFTYDTHPTKIPLALHPTSVPTTASRKQDTPYPLSPTQSRALLDLAQAILRCRDLVEKNMYSLLPPSDLRLIKARVVEPCQALGVPAAFSPPIWSTDAMSESATGLPAISIFPDYDGGAVSMHKRI